jgi:hypothetical protein
VPANRILVPTILSLRPLSSTTGNGQARGAGRTLVIEARSDIRKPDVTKPAPGSTVEVKKSTTVQQPQTEVEKPPRKFEELNEKERQSALDCLCQRSSTANQSAAGVGYDLKPRDASPDCSKTSNGPCINQGFGCWRHFPAGSGECATKCYGKANVASVPEATLNLGKQECPVNEQKNRKLPQMLNICVFATDK